MKLNNKRKIGVILIILTVVAFLTSATTVNAEINNTYGTNFGVDNTGLDETISNTTLLDLLGHFIFAIGRILEWTLGAIFKAITGSSDFPWADKIVFNAVPILDVNFINPNVKSFVGQSGIKTAIGNVYSTVFSLAFSFFGIFALLSAIKLALSTIAEQKAKYKQAVVDWAMGFVMLFCMHYFMSFMFYLNEQLVVTASDIATTAISQAGVKLDVQAAATGQTLIDNATAAGYGKKLSKYPTFATAWAGLNSGDDSDGINEALMKDEDVTKDTALAKKKIYSNLDLIVEWLESADSPTSTEIEAATAKVFYAEDDKSAHKNTSAIVEDVFKDLKLDELHKKIKGNNLFKDVFKYRTNLKGKAEVNNMFDGIEWNTEDVYTVSNQWINGSTAEGKALINSYGIKEDTAVTFYLSADNWTWENFLSDLKIIRNAYETDVAKAANAGNANAGNANAGNGGYTTAGAVITELATYFRATSYEAEFRSTNVSGTKEKGNINTVNAIMYAVLISQSLILFIAYIKRLFYVIVLGLMSPAVVAYDFFKRFGK